MNNTQNSSDWNAFDFHHYANQWYSSMIPEDREMIVFLVNELKSRGFKFGYESLDLVADVGTGPNLFPAMIFSQIAKKIHLIEYTQNGVKYLQEVLNNFKDKRSIHQRELWKKYGQKLCEIMSLDKDLLSIVSKKAQVVEGDIFKLEENAYDLVSSFFATESISDNTKTFVNSIESLLRSVKPGGIFITAHMLESEGYPAGLGTFFPSVPLKKSDLEKIFRSSLRVGDFKIKSFENTDITTRPRAGYEGTALVIGTVKNINSE
ncbi:hypothetical protein JW710_01205 [Candidatus Dojkabacteria bacterium]|nr:hypothetical protein [Candidatus Dojkabacteria bacterium]